MIIGTIGKNIKPMTVSGKRYLYHTGGMPGIELHPVYGQPGTFHGLQQARTRLILPYPGDQDRHTAESMQMPGNIEGRTTQDFLAGKPVNQNFAKQEYNMAGGGHPWKPPKRNRIDKAAAGTRVRQQVSD
jgi:hypothetical protein